MKDFYRMSEVLYTPHRKLNPRVPNSNPDQWVASMKKTFNYFEKMYDLTIYIHKILQRMNKIFIYSRWFHLGSQASGPLCLLTHGFNIREGEYNPFNM